jgi:uncharacterized phiE125 gp8 family phage protein
MTLYDDGLLTQDPHPPTRGRLLVRVLEPAGEPVTLSETRLYLRVDGTAEDALISDAIAAARQAAEQWLGRSLITQSWKLACDDALDDPLALPMGPVTAITGVTVVAQDGTSQTVPATSYWLDASRRRLRLNAQVYGFRVEVVYSAGYGAAAAVPKPIKLGILAHVAALFDQRGDLSDAAIPEAALQLYRPYREVRL